MKRYELGLVVLACLAVGLFLGFIVGHQLYPRVVVETVVVKAKGFTVELYTAEGVRKIGFQEGYLILAEKGYEMVMYFSEDMEAFTIVISPMPIAEGYFKPTTFHIEVYRNYKLVASGTRTVTEPREEIIIPLAWFEKPNPQETYTVKIKPT